MKRRTPACRAASSMFSVAVGPLACDWSGSRDRAGDAGDRRLVEDVLGPLDGPPADVEVGQVPLEPFVAALEVGEVGAVAGGEVVDHPHAPPLPREGLDQVRADEPGPARHHRQAAMVARHGSLIKGVAPPLGFRRSILPGRLEDRTAIAWPGTSRWMPAFWKARSRSRRVCS